jgi:hypothetical protein
MTVLGRKLPACFSLLCVALLAAPLLAPGVANAQVVLDDDDDVAPAPAAATDEEDPNAAKFGAGLRLRYTFIPTGIIEAFVERAEGGHSNVGFGVEGIRRRGNLEISFGLEYEKLEGDSGIWIDNDLSADLVEYDGFGWLTFDFTFTWHTKLHDFVSIRYGGGAGLGIIMGDVLQTDYVCTPADNAGSCAPEVGGDVRAPNEDIPPVFPVVNMLAGLQITPTDKIAINIEGGIRTVFYFGTGVAYYF